MIKVSALKTLFVGAATMTLAAFAAASPACASVPFGIESFETPILAGETGPPATQAGSHPYSMTTTITFNHIVLHEAPPVEVEAGGNPKNVEVKLPQGLIVNPDATVEKCTKAELAVRGQCPLTTVVGVATVYLRFLGGFAGEPIYNMEPPPGVPAELFFEPATVGFPVNIVGKVRTGGDYGLSAEASNITQKALAYGAKVTLWGDPYAASHDAERGTCASLTVEEKTKEKEEYEKEIKEKGFSERKYFFSCPVEGGKESKPFLTMPSSCPNEPLISSMGLDSWQEPENYLTATSESPPVTGCEKLQFNPALSVQPAEPSPEAASPESPTGLAVGLQLPQEEGLGEEGMSLLATSDLKEAVVTLPTGVTVSPSAANGLETCSLEQIGLNNANAPSCPAGSKLGTVQIETPLLEKPLQGAVYLAQQGNLPGDGSNPFGSLFALYLVAEGSGALVKLPGRVELNPESGQITARFGEDPITGQWLPQLPFSDLKMSFFGGPRAPLVTPSGCGTFTTSSQLTPWDGDPPAEPASSFTVGQGCATGSFAPSFSAGTSDNQGGAFSSFSTTFSRQDGEQHLSGVQVTMPPGLLGKIAGVPQCPEPQADRGECGEASLLGEATTAVGPGPDPYWVTGGKVYLTGPYNDGPFGLSIVVPTTAGPFTLTGNAGPGREVVRASIRVNPSTAQVTVLSDPLPTMLQGVPLDIRTVNVTVNRPGFLFNPTSCNPMAVTGALSGSEGASVPVSTRFQASGCASLPFVPALSASVGGHASKADGTGLTVKITSQGLGVANVHKVDLELPEALPSRNSTLNKACLVAVFEANPAGCSEESVIGYATVHTPVLEQPLSGPAYLVSHGGAAFPDVEFVLQGEGITLILDGKTQVKKEPDGAEVTYSRFETTPDAPFTTFETVLPAGPHSIFGAYANAKEPYDLCAANLSMPTVITAQDGAVIEQDTKITPEGCAGVLASKTSKPTRAQRLTKALAACHKKYKHSKRRRTACEKTARKRYGPKQKAHTAKQTPSRSRRR